MEKRSVLDFLNDSPEKALSRETLVILTGKTDREVRNEIHNAKLSKPIIHANGGYYICKDPNDKNLHIYIRQELHRQREVLRGIQACRMLAAEDTNQVRIF